MGPARKYKLFRDDDNKIKNSVVTQMSENLSENPLKITILDEDANSSKSAKTPFTPPR